MLLASPTLYPDQVLSASISADENNAAPVTCRLFIRYYGAEDALFSVDGPETTLTPGKEHAFKWRIPATNSTPIAEVGIEITNTQQAEGSIYLDYLTWDGMPSMVLTRPETTGTAWQRAWVPGVDSFGDRRPEPFRLILNHGRGLLIQGTREWNDYRVSSTLTPHLAHAMGIAARVQGMQRYYALTLSNDGRARLLKALDGEQILAETALLWELGRPYTLSLQVEGTRLQAWIDQQLLFNLEDKQQPLTGGAIALLCEEGRVSTDAVTIQAL